MMQLIITLQTPDERRQQLEEVASCATHLLNLVTELLDDVPEETNAPENVSGDGAIIRPTVLVVEDSPAIITLLQRTLEDHYTVLVASGGRAALQLAKSRNPDLILADVMMPGMNGFELCQAVKADPDLCTIPLIILTARTAEDDLLYGLQCGADDYLIKPFSVEELQARIANQIAVRRQLRQLYSREVTIQPSGVTVPPEDDAFLNRVTSLVDEELPDSSFDVNRLADLLEMSRRQLTRRLQETTGLAPAAFIRKMRLERATQLLRSHSGSVADVARKVGFRSSSHFTSVFHRSYGMTPSEYA